MINTFAGFEPCSPLIVITLPFILTPATLGIWCLYRSAKPTGAQAKQVALLLAAVSLIPIVGIEIVLFNADNYLTPEQITHINKLLLLYAFVGVPAIWLFARKRLKTMSQAQLNTCRSVFLKMLGVVCLGIAAAFIMADSRTQHLLR